MANSEYNYIPTYIRRTINNRPKDVVTAKYWNELFNLLIAQGDHTAEELGNILNYFSTRLIGVENEIAESAEAIANIRGVFRVNVTSSNGVYTADKTFDEIKAAYNAGQQPYVVVTGNTLDLVYTLANFDAPTDGSEPKFVNFVRYLVGDGILETEMLRVYSYTTDSGSNVVKIIDKFKMPTSLKNPNALTFTGGATGSYDGSEPETVHIPVIPYEVINKNTAARHSHDNKTVLDGITAGDVEKWRGTIGTFRINVTYSHSDSVGGVYSADKTFAEIKDAYDAGQLPYVVEDALSGFYDIYTFSHFWYDESSAQGFADFECYRILTGTLKTITLRIHSRTLESGSNIERRTEEFNVPSGAGIQSVEQTTTSTEDGGTNIITVTKTDGTSSTFTVRNGSKGSTGATGADGKSAYQYAKEGGYTGTETEFAKKLASEAMIVHVTDSNGTLSADKSYSDIANAIVAGTTVLVYYDGNGLPLITVTNAALYFGTIQCDSGDATNPAVVATVIIEITQNGEVNDVSAFVETLPNPNSITFTGAVTGSYDGSAAMTVNIPSAVTDAHINSLIDTKLGVIENGSY